MYEKVKLCFLKGRAAIPLSSAELSDDRECHMIPAVNVPDIRYFINGAMVILISAICSPKKIAAQIATYFKTFSKPFPNSLFLNALNNIVKLQDLSYAVSGYFSACKYA